MLRLKLFEVKQLKLKADLKFIESTFVFNFHSNV